MGAEVSVDYPKRGKANTDDEGRFRLTFPHAGGEIHVWARHAGLGVPQRIGVNPRTAEARDLKFLIPGCRLIATIRSASDRKGIPKAYLRFDLTPKEKTKQPMYLTFPADNEGRLTIDGVAEGKVELRAGGPGYGESPARVVELSKDHPEESIEIELERVARISCSVVDTAGGLIPGAKLSGPLTYSGSAPPVEAGPNGHFDVEIPADRASILVAWAPGYRLGFFPVAPNVESVALALLPVGSSSEIELRKQDGGLFDAQPFWQLLATGIPIEPEVIRDAFQANGCAELVPKSSRSSTKLGGCLMPGSYRLLMTVRDVDEPRRYRTESFDPTTGRELRVTAVEQ